MYKLFLCLRYLRSRVLAYFAMACVALCVMMMVIVISVMNGFLNKIEHAAKGLFGDVVVESVSLSGMGEYDKFIESLKTMPEVCDAQGRPMATPFILTYGIVRVPGHDYRQTVQVAGIRLPERARATDFAKGLFVQGGQSEPTFEPPASQVLERLRADETFLREIYDTSGQEAHVREQAAVAISNHQIARANIEDASQTDLECARIEEKIQAAHAAGDPAREASLQRELNQAGQRQILPAKYRVILGLGIPGMSARTPKGQVMRFIVPGDQVVLTLVPLGRDFGAQLDRTDQRFTVIDDCRTDVSSIDMNFVYVPFETLQAITKMDGRCSAIHVKVRDGLADEQHLDAVRAKIQEAWTQFTKDNPQAALSEVSIKTWRQRQAPIISNITAQRTLVVIMFGIMSTVAVVLVFVLFYIIVVQKTRDIGVLKSIGASSAGVAGIFLGYGAFIGLIGSVLGVIGGMIFVYNINPIHEWVGRTFGFQVWSREWFLFDKIPNDVQPETAVYIVICAIVACIFGSLYPAIRAALMQPVEALRYE